MLASDYIVNALRLCGQQMQPGRGPTPEQQVESLLFFNQMLDGWNIMRNALYTVQDLLFPLTANTQFYLIGAGAAPATIGGVSYGAFNTPRPNWIQEANLVYAAGAANQVRIPLRLLSTEQWADIRITQIPAAGQAGTGLFALPTTLYYDHSYSQTGTQGLGMIAFWPGPDGSNTYEVELFVPASLPTTLSYGTPVYVPPGYQRALTYSLAVEVLPLCTRGGSVITAEQEARIQRIAVESRMYVNNLNSPKLLMRIDPALSSSETRSTAFNYLTGNY